MAANVFAVAALAVAAYFSLQPRLRRADWWRATVTPLASIIGSGFLVSLPLLARDMGAYAPAAMALLLALAYGFGGAIRFNIAHGETLFDDAGNDWLTRFENFSRLALAIAYFVSVTYYLSLLAAFALKGFALGDEGAIARLITTSLLAALGVGGFVRGLRGLEAIEEIAVGLKLAVIAAVLAALALMNLALVFHGAWAVRAAAPRLDPHHLRIVLGLLIVVQGFETSRFLKGAYTPALRIRTMRWAQFIAAAIYLAFFALALPILNTAPDTPDVAGVTDMMAPIASLLPLMLIAGAVFAQLSAAIADAIGAAGLIHETSGKRVRQQWTYPLIAAIGITLVWAFDVFRVIQVASAAFALYYAFQCAVAAWTAQAAKTVSHRALRTGGFALLALGALAAALFGIPAEAAG
jgi:hypothetical protein